MCVCARACSLEGHGPVDQVEVQVGEAELGQAAPAGRLHVLWVVLGVPQLRRHKHLLTTQLLRETEEPPLTMKPPPGVDSLSLSEETLLLNTLPASSCTSQRFL